MDSITHTLVGAALGEAGLKRRSGLGMAALIIGANLPDADLFYEMLAKDWTFRHGVTHGVLAVLVLPVILTGALVGFDRLRSTGGAPRPGRLPVRPKQLLLLSAIAVLSHLVLDWLTPYGVRLLMPFSERWFYGDTLSEFDPWVFIALVAGIVVARVRARSAGSAGGGGGSSTRPAKIALVVSAAYVALMVFGGRAAERMATQYIIATEQRTPRRVLAAPVLGNPFRRELVLDFGETYRFGRMDWFSRPRVTLDERDVPTNQRDPAVEAVRGRLHDFLYWSRYPFFRIDDEAQPPVVIVGDAGRFGRIGVLRVPYAAVK